MTVKVIETNGPRMEHTLTKPDCNRDNCLVCKSMDKGKSHCRKTNVICRITCKLRKAQGQQVKYWGETSWSSYLRGQSIRGT